MPAFDRSLQGFSDSEDSCRNCTFLVLREEIIGPSLQFLRGHRRMFACYEHKAQIVSVMLVREIKQIVMLAICATRETYRSRLLKYIKINAPEPAAELK